MCKKCNIFPDSCSALLFEVKCIYSHTMTFPIKGQSHSKVNDLGKTIVATVKKITTYNVHMLLDLLKLFKLV